MPRRAPWFKLDAHWWLTDPRVQAMNATAAGALIRLLCIAWGDGSREPLLPDDTVKLAEMAKLTPTEWDKHGPDILSLTKPTPSGLHLYFPVQMDQWNEMRESYERRANAGALGGTAKAQSKRKKDTDLPAVQTPVDRAWQTIREAYPKRLGDQGWRAAESRFRAIVKKGADPAKVVDAVFAYGAFMAAQGNIGTSFVKKAETFFGREKCWEHNWTVPAGGIAQNGKPSAGRRMFDNITEN